MRHRAARLVIAGSILAAMLLSSSMAETNREERDKWPDATYLAYMRNVYQLNPGEGEWYCRLYPALASVIRGK